MNQNLTKVSINPFIYPMVVFNGIGKNLKF